MVGKTRLEQMAGRCRQQAFELSSNQIKAGPVETGADETEPSAPPFMKL